MELPIISHGIHKAMAKGIVNVISKRIVDKIPKEIFQANTTQHFIPSCWMPELTLSLAEQKFGTYHINLNEVRRTTVHQYNNKKSALIQKFEDLWLLTRAFKCCVYSQTNYCYSIWLSYDCSAVPVVIQFQFQATYSSLISFVATINPIVYGKTALMAIKFRSFHCV